MKVSRRKGSWFKVRWTDPATGRRKESVSYYDEPSALDRAADLLLGDADEAEVVPVTAPFERGGSS